MIYKDCIKIKGRLKIYEDSKLILDADNTLVNGTSMTGHQMSRPLSFNDYIINAGADYADYVDTHGSIPTAIYAEDSSGNHWWMPIYVFTEGGSGLVTYQAQMLGTEFIHEIHTLYLGALNNWKKCTFVVDPSSADIGKIEIAALPTWLNSNHFVGQPAICYGKFSVSGSSQTFVLPQTYGFSPSLSTEDFRIYDDGTQWMVELGSTIGYEPSNKGQIIINAKFGQYRTAASTNMNKFSTYDCIGASNIINHTLGKLLTFIWELQYS